MADNCCSTNGGIDSIDTRSAVQSSSVTLKKTHHVNKGLWETIGTAPNETNGVLEKYHNSSSMTVLVQLNIQQYTTTVF